MTDIERFKGPMSGALSRRAQHAIAQLDDRTSVVLAGIQAEAEISTAEIAAVGFVAQRAELEIALVSQIEQTLAQVVPIAASRLQAIGDVASLAIAQIVADTPNRLRNR